MKKLQDYSRVLPWFMALLLGALLVACGGGRDPILGTPGAGLSAPVSIAVTPTTASIPMQGQQAFVATATYSDGSTRDVSATSSWSSGSPSVASVNASSGLATGVVGGIALITATFDGKTSSANLTVTAATLVSIAITPATATVPINAFQPFMATATYSDGSTENVTATSSWSSGSASVATVNATSGMATGVVGGTALITATFGGKTGSATVTVPSATLTSIAVTPATATVQLGLTQALVAMGTYSDGTSADISSTVAWTSGSPAIATVIANTGVATGVAVGSATVTATASGKTGSATLTVPSATLTSIAVTPATAAVQIGLSQPFVAKGTYSDGSNTDISSTVAWTSGSPLVATVLSGTGVATGVAVGSATITATLGSKSGSAVLTVSATVPVPTAHGPAPVGLGTAGNFVLLSKSGISTTGTSAVVGDIGVSPVAASSITGFGLIADSTNTFSTSSLVTGKVYAANYTPPTPANMTTAVSDMQTAFTDAAGRATPDFTELYAGNISGMTLVPGLYKWGTGVLITSAGVTLTGGANDVWIFQIAQNLTVNNSAIVTLSGGAQAKNVFWQVAGQATIGTGAKFKGNILSQTLISFNTGAELVGRALAQTAVTLNATSVTKP